MRHFSLIAAFLLAAGPREAAAQVTVYQINDVYRIDAVDNGTAGGLGRISTLVEQSKQAGESVLILHGGDFIAPSLESQYWGGRQIIDALNFLHDQAPLLVVPGNHEYDARNPAMLADAVQASRFPWIASNLQLTTGTAADARIQADTIIEIGGMRLGIFGLTMIDEPRSYARVDSMYVGIAIKRIRALDEAGADVIVALSHLPVELDTTIAKLRGAHPKFVWVVSGHEHNSFAFPLSANRALVTNAESNARDVYRIILSADSAGPRASVETFALDSTIAENAAYDSTVVQPYRAKLKDIIPFIDQRIGTAGVALDAREETVRGAESNWGNYLTDVMRNAYPDFPADIAVLNGGAIRLDDVVSGPIRWEHLARTFGFPTRVALVWLRGADVVSRVLEQSVSAVPGNGRFLQVSGVKFAFDWRKPVGSRVSNVRVQRNGAWAPIDSAAVYVVAVPDYSYGGGDGYTFRGRALMTVPPGPDLKYLVFDALTDAFAKGRPIAPKVEGRIVEIGN